MSGFLVELPPELHAEIVRRVGQQPGGEPAFVAEAVREKLAACAELEYLETRAARGDRDTFTAVLARVPQIEPIPGDERAAP